jgi:hypothetical protein
MIYKAIKPIQEGFCRGCIFSTYDRHCNNVDSIKYQCCDEYGNHVHIYIPVVLKINNNIKIL